MLANRASNDRYASEHDLLRMIRMSLRHHQWMLAIVPSLAVYSSNIAWSQDAVLVRPASASLDQSTAPFSATGLIRILEEAQASGASGLETASNISEQDGLSDKSKDGEKRVDNDANEPSKNNTSATPTVKPVDGKPVDGKLGPIQLTPITTPNTNLVGVGTGLRPEDATEGRLPAAQWLPTGTTRDGMWSLQAKAWVPGGFCHQPLYFEDPMLERHGHETESHLQPFYSGLRFFGTIPVLPYLATLRHPLDEVHTLGAYRPGSCVPMLRYRPHYDPAALRNEVLSVGAVVTGVAP